MASTRWAALVASVPLFLAAAPVRAAPGVPDDGVHRHERFYMRFLLGPGVLAASTTDEDEGEEVTVSGAGVTFQVALGYNLLPNLILYGEVFDDVTFGPSAESDGDEDKLEDTSFGMIGLGVGLAYYFPHNIALSAAASLASLRVDYTDNGVDRSNETDGGLGVNVVLAKEFWVSEDWALGVAVRGFFGSVPDAESAGSWGVGALAAGLSATYD